MKKILLSFVAVIASCTFVSGSKPPSGGNPPGGGSTTIKKGTVDNPDGLTLPTTPVIPNPVPPSNAPACASRVISISGSNSNRQDILVRLRSRT